MKNPRLSTKEDRNKIAKAAKKRAEAFGKKSSDKLARDMVKRGNVFAKKIRV